MNTLHPSEADEPKAAGWLHHAAIGLLGLAALLSLVLSFAVEFVAAGDLQRRAQGLRNASQTPTMVDARAGSDRPLLPAH